MGLGLGWGLNVQKRIKHSARKKHATFKNNPCINVIHAIIGIYLVSPTCQKCRAGLLLGLGLG